MLVRKVRNKSGVRFFDKCVENARMNAVNVWRHAKGKEVSWGKIGEYHHLMDVSYKSILGVLILTSRSRR